MSNKDLYASFEAKHRGPRELIKQRVSVYLPFILPLKKLYPKAIAIDIGCGRGEWLELLQEHDITALGIDQDEGMLMACANLNLNVKHADGIEILKQQKDNSATIVSAFHVVEHISFEILQTLIKEALRVLKPAGLLILETPNPENIRVSTESFYLDPTHNKPIPSGLLSFLPEYFGFERTKVLRLQENKNILNQPHISLLDVLGEVSPDYAIITQKSASASFTKPFDPFFDEKFGYSLELLASKFEERLQRMETQTEQNRVNNDHLFSLLEGEVAMYHKMKQSTSWKLTKPLRFTLNALKWLVRQPIKAGRRYFAMLKYKIYARPKLKKMLRDTLYKFPPLKNIFLSIMNTSHYKKHSLVVPKNIRNTLKKTKRKVEKRKKAFHV